MNASVLILGEQDFPAKIVHQVRGLSALTLRTTTSIPEAEEILQREPPELMIVQANQPEHWALCRSVKQQRSLSWIYCILVDTQPAPSATGEDSWLVRYTNLTTMALEGGADAYLWLNGHGGEEDGTWDDSQHRLLQAQIRLGLRRVQSYRELSRTNDLLAAIALSDPLTQLGNRRAFDWELPRQIQTARAQNLPLSLLVLDIDHFKSVNDEYGHLIGDKVLQMVAERMSQNMRFYETPFRYGGEEFVVILNSTTAEDALMIGRRLCRLIGERPFVVHEDFDLTVTVSIGVAGLKEEDDPRGVSFLDRADHNLLKAKTEGRNRVVKS